MEANDIERFFASVADEHDEANKEYIKVLVFMDVSSPDLVDASAAAQASIMTALLSVSHRIRRRIFIRVLVHGYQNADTFEIDSTLIRIDGRACPRTDPCKDAQKRIQLRCRGERRAPAVPTDGEALRAFVIDSIREVCPAVEGGEAEEAGAEAAGLRGLHVVDPHETLCCSDPPRESQGDSSGSAPAATPPEFKTILFIWGHAEGVGNRLDFALDSRRNAAERLPATVEGASLLGSTTAAGSPLRRLRNLPCDVRPRDGSPVFDLMVFDSCLMATAELAYECRDLTQYVIASQTLVMRPGLSLGRAITEYLVTYEQSAHIQAEHGDLMHVVVFARTRQMPQRQNLVTPLSPGIDLIRDAAKAIIDTAGELHSGADQLTLFRAKALFRCEEPFPPPPESLGRWIKRAIGGLNLPGQQGADFASTVRPPDVACRLFDARHLELFKRHAGVGIFTLFAHLLRWASADEREQPRILAAFKNALYIQVRQFLDLKDLARQVYHYSRLVPLRVVALELMRELEENDCGLVVRWRATIPAKDRKRYGGVSVYCPWFDAKGPCEYDALVEHEVYRELDLPSQTGWGGFVLGAMYDATAGRRRRAEECERRLIEQDRRWTRILREALRDCNRPRRCGCGCEGGDAEGGGESQAKGGGPQGDGPKGGGPQGDFGG